MTALGEGGVWVGSFSVDLFSRVVLDMLQTFVCRDLGTQWENAWHQFLSRTRPTSFPGKEKT